MKRQIYMIYMNDLNLQNSVIKSIVNIAQLSHKKTGWQNGEAAIPTITVNKNFKYLKSLLVPIFLFMEVNIKM